MAADYTRQWIQFFAGCGIPKDVATTYGLIFNENRIKKNMLLDLNKEYLRDMGITVMGDIIAILRHAKVVHDKLVREQILTNPESKLVENYAVSDIECNKANSMKKIAENFALKYESSELGSHKNVKIQIDKDNDLITVQDKVNVQSGNQNNITVKKKIEAPSLRNDNFVPSNPAIIGSKIRSLQANEGNCNIKLLSRTTETSKKIIEKAKLKQSKTIFDRLGESSVSSSSDVKSTAENTVNPVRAPVIKVKNFSSVFDRLGEKSPLVTSTSSNGDSSEQLHYRGILKTTGERKNLKISARSTMRADALGEIHLFDAKAVKTNLKGRLGTAKKVESSSSRGSITLNSLQITTTFEEEMEPEPLQAKTLSTRFKSMNMTSNVSNKEQKPDSLLKSIGFECNKKKSKVSSTTQEGTNHGIKRRLEASEPVDSKEEDVMQSKKVRFGHTTQRLIPGNSATEGTSKEYRNLRMMIGKQLEPKNSKKLSEKPDVMTGLISSNKMKQKLTVKERIGNSSVLKKFDKITIDNKQKSFLKLQSRNKMNSMSIYDRLG